MVYKIYWYFERRSTITAKSVTNPLRQFETNDLILNLAVGIQ